MRRVTQDYFLVFPAVLLRIALQLALVLALCVIVTLGGKGFASTFGHWLKDMVLVELSIWID